MFASTCFWLNLERVWKKKTAFSFCFLKGKLLIYFRGKVPFSEKLTPKRELAQVEVHDGFLFAWRGLEKMARMMVMEAICTT